MTPTPAATSAMADMVSSASKATRGSKPASRQARSVIWRQPQRGVEAIHGSSARSASFSRRRSASGWLAGDDRVVGVVEQVGELQVRAQRAGQRLEVVDQRQVDVAAAQALDGLGGLGLDHAQLDLGVALVELATARGSERGAGALEAGQAQPAAAQAGQLGQLVLGALEPGQDGVGVGQQRAAGLGEAHAARRAVQQLGAGLALQGRHLLADAPTG